AINDMAFPGLPEPFADWIGVGEASDKRSPQQNEDILQRFQDNKLPCLVQVNKAGEGFNNKRCSIGLMLDMVGDTPQKRQHIGRFLRVNPDAPETDAVILLAPIILAGNCLKTCRNRSRRTQPITRTDKAEILAVGRSS
ncbi:MAG: helicase-related protein, partial [bacterium]